MSADDYKLAEQQDACNLANLLVGGRPSMPKLSNYVNIDSGVCEKNFALVARKLESRDPPL